MNRKIICTPIKHKKISQNKRYAGKSCSHTDFEQQKKRNEFILDGNEFWCWDDAQSNKGRVGDVFIFWVYNGVGKGGRGNPWGGGNFIFHEVVSVRDPSERLPDWTRNVGQGSRKVLHLSPPRLTLMYDDMIKYDAIPSHNGTKYYAEKRFRKGSPIMNLMRLIEENLT